MDTQTAQLVDNLATLAEDAQHRAGLVRRLVTTNLSPNRDGEAAVLDAALSLLNDVDRLLRAMRIAMNGEDGMADIPF